MTNTNTPHHASPRSFVSYVISPSIALPTRSRIEGGTQSAVQSAVQSYRTYVEANHAACSVGARVFYILYGRRHDGSLDILCHRDQPISIACILSLILGRAVSPSADEQELANTTHPWLSHPDAVVIAQQLIDEYDTASHATPDVQLQMQYQAWYHGACALAWQLGLVAAGSFAAMALPPR